MKLVVGLGNPGLAYADTKHNVGFWVLDAFARECHLRFSAKKGEALICRGTYDAPDGGIDFLLLKPQTFMNLSGQAVASLLRYYKIPLSELVLIYDDLDLEPGRLRIKKQGGAGGHRGVASVIENLGSKQFLRLKIGIGHDPGIETADYVLSRFRSEDKKKVLEALQTALQALPLLLEGNVLEAMNRFNAA